MKKSKSTKRAFVLVSPLILLILLFFVKAINNPPSKVDFLLHRGELEHIVYAVKHSGLKVGKKNSWNLLYWDGLKPLSRMPIKNESDALNRDVYANRVNDGYMIAIVAKVKPCGSDPLSYGCDMEHGYVCFGYLPEVMKGVRVDVPGPLQLKRDRINAHWWGASSTG
jgi:hypothetical protein